MHEANLAIVFKMAKWTKDTLAMREAPYSAATRNITFVSAGLEINQATGTIHPKPSQVEPDSSSSSDEYMSNPIAYPESVRQALVTRMKQGRVFMAKDATISRDGPPLCVEVDATPRPPQVVETTAEAKEAVDREQAIHAHLPISQEFTQENLDNALSKAQPGTDDVLPRPDETRFPKQQTSTPRAKSLKRGRASTASSSSLPPAEGAATRVPAVIPKLDLTGSVTRNIPMSPDTPRLYTAEETGSSAEEPPYQRTDRDDQIGTTATSSIAEGGAQPMSATGASSGSTLLPTPRTQAAEALERLTLGSQPPAPSQ